MHIMNMQEFAAVVAAEVRAREGRIREEHDGVCLTITGDYFIPWSRIDTSEKLLDWLEHLLLKGWFLPLDAVELIRIVTRKFAISYQGKG